MPGDEHFNFIKNCPLIADPRHVVLAAELNQFGTGNLLGHVARVLHVNDALIGAMQNQRRYTRDGQDIPDIDLPIHAHDRRCCAWAC